MVRISNLDDVRYQCEIDLQNMCVLSDQSLVHAHNNVLLSLVRRSGFPI